MTSLMTAFRYRIERRRTPPEYGLEFTVQARFDLRVCGDHLPGVG